MKKPSTKSTVPRSTTSIDLARVTGGTGTILVFGEIKAPRDVSTGLPTGK